MSIEPPQDRPFLAPLTRFSNRAEDYRRYRPGYPDGLLELLEREARLSEGSAVADVGAGTGISAEMFLNAGYRVYLVEPNAEMRRQAESALAGRPNAVFVDGSAEETGLPDAVADLAIAATAFHWFDAKAARKEFKRILKPGGLAALIWNERVRSGTPFLVEYEAVISRYGSDHATVRSLDAPIGAFFENGHERVVFDNSQSLDRDGLIGRVASSSYMPVPGDEAFEGMSQDLSELFAKHSENGKIQILYNTTVHYARL